MIGREEVVRALKAMNRQTNWDLPDAAKLFTDSIWNENDRGVIILNGSAIEELLMIYIKRRMTHLNAEEADYLFGFNGPIGTFSSKIRMAHALGIIDRKIFRKIDLIREMRNTCAHSPQPITFQSKPIFDAVICLVHDLKFALPDQDNHEAIRKTFMLASILLLMVVQSGSHEQSHVRLLQIMKRGQPSLGKPAE